MNTQPSLEETTTALHDLHVTDSPAPYKSSLHSDVNPWEEEVQDREIRLPTVPISIPDSLALGETGKADSTDHITSQLMEVSVDPNVLNEFDPLAHEQEQLAKDAWEQSEGHPQQQQSVLDSEETELQSATSSPVIPTPKAQSQVQSETISPVASSPTFSSLAALARTFSIPGLQRNRPVSIDSAKIVPSPSTLSAFASQQPRVSKRQPDGGPSPDESSSRARSNSGTPVPGGEDGRKDIDKAPPFDFQQFLDQMKVKGAEPVAKYLKSFLSNFTKRIFTVADQVKIIRDFLDFIAERMRESDVWRNASDAEFENAMEGMEKLVMNRLYDFTFTPAVANSVPPRPITTDDLERDRVLSQRIALFGWIEEKHLDIPTGEGSKGFLMFAQQELLKINHYKAPRDKLICILNCCKVIFGLIRHLKKDEGADSFVPILIFVVLKANPDHLLSNVEFINRFRNPVKLQSEAGYYLSSLMGAVSFVETMDHASLSSITQQEFEKNVEDAIQALPPSQPPSRAKTPDSSILQQPGNGSGLWSLAPASPHAGEESAQPLALPAPGPSENARRFLQKTGDTLSKPLTAIGRIFTEALDGADGPLTYLPGPFTPFEIGKERERQANERSSPVPSDQGTSSGPLQTPVQSASQYTSTYGAQVQTPYKPRVRRIPSPSSQFSPSSTDQLSPDTTPTRHGPSLSVPYTHQPLAMGPSQTIPPRVQSLGRTQSPGTPHISRTATPNLDFTGMQVEIDNAHERAAQASRVTLRQIFPSVDQEVVDWVLEANGGDVGKSIEALLEMNSGT